MSGGEKGNKKKKGKTVMSLDQFHNLGNEESESAVPSVVVHRNWAEEMEQQDQDADQKPSYVVVDRSMLPKAPKAILGPDIDMESVPKEKPFRAHLSNISYDADETHIKTFFKDSKIESINLSKTDRGSGHRGFGTIEFEDRESLVNALIKNDSSLLTRKIRVALRDAHNDRMGGGGGNRDGGEQSNRSDLDTDWRRREPGGGEAEGEGQNDAVDNNRRGGDFYQHDQRRGDNQRGGYQNRGYGGDRQQQGGDRPYGSGFRNRDQNNQDSNSNWTDRRNNRNRPGYQRNSGGEEQHGQGGEQQRRYGDRQHGGDRQPYGGDRQQQYGGDRQQYGGDRQQYGGDRSHGGDRQHGGGYRKQYQPQQHQQPAQEATNEAGETAPVDAELPKERPKLLLQPRSKPIESPEILKEGASSIFGGAKPVDTAARERAIEEKLKAEQKAKQEEEKDKEGKEEEAAQEEHADARSTTASVDHTRPQQDKQSFRPSQHRGDQKFYSAKSGRQHNQSYESNEATSPQQHHDSNHRSFENRRERQHSDRDQQQQQQRRSNHQQNQNENRPFNRSANDGHHQQQHRDSAPSHRTPQKETVVAPPPATNAWNRGPAVIQLFGNTAAPQQESPEEVTQAPVVSQPQANDNRINSSNPKYQNRPQSKPYQAGTDSNNRYNKENRSANNPNRRNNNNDSNNNSTSNNNNKKQFNKKGDGNRRGVGGDEQQSQQRQTYPQRAFPAQQQPQQQSSDDKELVNKYSKLAVEDGFDDQEE